MLTVKELKEALANLPDDLPVVRSDHEWHIVEIYAKPTIDWIAEDGNYSETYFRTTEGKPGAFKALHI